MVNWDLLSWSRSVCTKYTTISALILYFFKQRSEVMFALFFDSCTVAGLYDLMHSSERQYKPFKYLTNPFGHCFPLPRLCIVHSTVRVCLLFQLCGLGREGMPRTHQPQHFKEDSVSLSLSLYILLQYLLLVYSLSLQSLSPPSGKRVWLQPEFHV